MLRRKAGPLSGLLAVVVAATLIAFPGMAHADVLYSGIYRNWDTARCLDSNAAGNAYTLGCNGGNYQNWKIDHVQTYNGWLFGFRIINQQTERCLDSNAAGWVYTLPCNGGDYQVWWMYGIDDTHQVWVNKATGNTLTDNGSLVAVPVWNPWGAAGSGQWRPGY
jgi:serine/threonine-protein kinase